MSGRSSVLQREEGPVLLSVFRGNEGPRPQSHDGYLIRPERLRELADAGLGLHIYQCSDGINVDRVPATHFGVDGASSG